MRDSKPPPLRPEEVQRVLGQLVPLIQDTQIVLVGGQALAFWSAALPTAVVPEAFRTRRYPQMRDRVEQIRHSTA